MDNRDLNLNDIAWSNENFAGIINFRPCGYELWNKKFPFTIWRCGSANHLDYDKIKILSKNFGINVIFNLCSDIEMPKINTLTNNIEYYMLQFPEISNNFLTLLHPTEEDYISLYWDYLIKASETIKLFFKKFTNTNHQKILIGCYAGKDRTGIICSLILGLLTDDINIIINDYHASSRYLLAQLDFFEKEWKKRKLTREVYAKRYECNPKIMETIMKQLIDKYGSVYDYLLTIGVLEAELQNIIQRYKLFIRENNL